MKAAMCDAVFGQLNSEYTCERERDRGKTQALQHS